MNREIPSHEADHDEHSQLQVERLGAVLRGEEHHQGAGVPLDLGHQLPGFRPREELAPRSNSRSESPYETSSNQKHKENLSEICYTK